jgi:pyruvate,water dikinase
VTLPALLAHLEETTARDKRLWEIHFLLLPCLVAMNVFDELCCDLFGDERGLDQYRLLQGLDNKSLEADRALWRLSRKARATPAVNHLLAEHDARTAVPLLEASSEARTFLADLRVFLAEYGRRGARSTVTDPSWIEDPTPVIQNLKNYVVQPDRDLDAEMAARARERDRLIEERRQRLASYPRPFLEQFDFYLRAAQEATVLEEDHNFWIDQRWVYEVRRVLMEFGRRFADARVLDAPEDVFYLTLAELRETARSLAADVRRSGEIVGVRKAEMERFRAIAPPTMLGTPPVGPAQDTPLGRAVHKFFGVPVAQGTDPDVVRGHSGSPGIARGPARVVRTLSEAGKLEPGDILVAEATMPPWTPLFATVAAVVTDVGGVTCHSAVVAREYQIPAVVGTGDGTSRIQDGHLLEVDGSAGVVRIVSRV